MTHDAPWTDDNPAGEPAASPDVIVATANRQLLSEIRLWIAEATGLEATAVESAAALLERLRPGLARLVVIDEALPGTGGLVTGAMVREVHPSVRLILAVAEVHPVTRHMAEEIGFSMLMERRRDGFVLGGLGG